MPNPRITIIGNIGPDVLHQVTTLLTGFKLADAHQRAANQQLPPLVIDVLINSWGGDPGTGFGLYNVLQSSGGKIRTFNLGEVSSAATLPFLAGEERFAAKHSFFKFHPLTWDLHASGTHGAGRLIDVSTSLETLSAGFQKIYEERTKMKSGEIAGFFLKTATFTPEEAKKRGIIHDVAAAIPI